jgi:two-component system sensor histidine kinase KdpD
VGDRIDLRIIDRGIGVPPPQRDRMFEPFQRLGDGGDVSDGAERAAAAAADETAMIVAPNGHSSGVNGVGLGLAVAKGFVEAIGGELILDDTPGGGLTAIIELRKVAS